MNKNKKQKNKKGCERCGRNHELKDCFWATGACFRCGNKEHVIANCPERTPKEYKHEDEGQS